MFLCKDLVEYLDKLLQPEKCHDYAPNGLQVMGQAGISHIVTGVSANLALIEAAIEKGADTLLVHHGLFWEKGSPCVVGFKHARLKALLVNNLNLLAYHLPLDVHPVYGNNAQLAEIFGIKIIQLVKVGGIDNLLTLGMFPKPRTKDEISKEISKKLMREPFHVGPKDKPIQKIALCSGGAQGFLEDAIAHGVDAYITGEVSESCYAVAKESNIHFFGCGHHATERYGIQALGNHLAKQYKVQHTFIDIPNPI